MFAQLDTASNNVTKKGILQRHVSTQAVCNKPSKEQLQRFSIGVKTFGVGEHDVES